MFAYIIWGIILLLVFLLRERLAGFFVGSLVLLVMVFISLFILDFYTVWDPNNQGLVNLHLYNQTVEDPAKAASEIGEMVTDAGKDVTKGVSETGSTLDEQFGVVETETRNGVTTDETGKWLSTEESTDEDSAQESETKTTSTEGTETKSWLTYFNFGAKDSSSEDSTTSKTNEEGSKSGSKVELTYTDLAVQLKDLELTEGDKELLHSLSPYNLGRIEGADIIVTNSVDKIILEWK